MLHTEFLAAFRRIIPAEWRIYAESCLHIPEENVRAAARVMDHFFVDIKDMDPAVYRDYTGKDNALVKANLALLLSLVGAERVTVRVPLIPGFNTPEHTDASVAELQAMGVTLVDRFTYKMPQGKS